MFYESLIDNMEVGKSYTINKENLIFVKNMILDLKDDLEKDAVLTKLVKKYDLEPETSIYLYEGNLIGENVLEIKSKEYLFPFLIDRKLYCYGTNEVIEDNTKFYYKNFNVYSIEDLKKDVVLKKYINTEENIVDKGDDILEIYFDFEKFESYEEFVERINQRIDTFILDEKEFDDKDKKVKYIRSYGIEVRNKRQCKKVIKKYRKVLTDNFINENKTKRIYFWNNLKNIFKI